MPTGVFGFEDKYRNQRLAMEGIGTELGTVTTTSEAGTLNDFMGVITTNTLDATAGNNETITLTNNKVSSGDAVLANIIGGTSAGTPVLVKSVVGSGTITFTIKNDHASAAFDGTLIIAYVIIKNLSGL